MANNIGQQPKTPSQGLQTISTVLGGVQTFGNIQSGAMERQLKQAQLDEQAKLKQPIGEEDSALYNSLGATTTPETIREDAVRRFGGVKDLFDRKQNTKNEYDKTVSLLIPQKQAELQQELKKKQLIPSEQENKDARFATLMQNGDVLANKLAKEGFDRSSKLNSFQSMLPGAVQSNGANTQEAAENMFVNGLLRDESGAAISPKEREQYKAAYFPRAGNSSEIIDSKNKARQIAIESMKQSAQGAYNQLLPKVKNQMLQKGSETQGQQQPEQRVINGSTYRKVPGGWEEVTK